MKCPTRPVPAPIRKLNARPDRCPDIFPCPMPARCRSGRAPGRPGKSGRPLTSSLDSKISLDVGSLNKPQSWNLFFFSWATLWFHTFHANNTNIEHAIALHYHQNKHHTFDENKCSKLIKVVRNEKYLDAWESMYFNKYSDHIMNVPLSNSFCLNFASVKVYFYFTNDYNLM